MSVKVLGPRALKQAATFVDALVMRGIDRADAAKIVGDFALKIAGKKPKGESLGLGMLRVEEHYKGEYYKRFREMPLLSMQRDRGILAQLVRQYGEQLTMDRISAFFVLGDTDAFVRESGYSISVLRVKWQKLAQVVNPQRVVVSGCRHQPPCPTASEHTRKELERLRGTSHLPTTSKSSGPSLVGPSSGLNHSRSS